MNINIDEMAEAYMACALWSTNDDDDRPLDARFAICDIDEDTQEEMTKDCREFVMAAKSMLEDLDATSDQVGHDFWLTRNGHGAGFWDRGYGRLGQYLSDLSHHFGEEWLYPGANGKVHN